VSRTFLPSQDSPTGKTVPGSKLSITVDENPAYLYTAFIGDSRTTNVLSPSHVTPSGPAMPPGSGNTKLSVIVVENPECLYNLPCIKSELKKLSPSKTRPTGPSDGLRKLVKIVDVNPACLYSLVSS
jgi:hypothetical protein